MNNTSLAGVIMSNAVIFICDPLPSTISRRRYCGFAFPSADDFNAAMVNCHGFSPLFDGGISFSFVPIGANALCKSARTTFMWYISALFTQKEGRPGHTGAPVSRGFGCGDYTSCQGNRHVSLNNYWPRLPQMVFIVLPCPLISKTLSFRITYFHCDVKIA